MCVSTSEVFRAQQGISGALGMSKKPMNNFFKMTTSSFQRVRVSLGDILRKNVTMSWWLTMWCLGMTLIETPVKIDM